MSSQAGEGTGSLLQLCELLRKQQQEKNGATPPVMPSVSRGNGAPAPSMSMTQTNPNFGAHLNGGHAPGPGGVGQPTFLPKASSAPYPPIYGSGNAPLHTMGRPPMHMPHAPATAAGPSAPGVGLGGGLPGHYGGGGGGGMAPPGVPGPDGYVSMSVLNALSQQLQQHNYLQQQRMNHHMMAARSGGMPSFPPPPAGSHAGAPAGGMPWKRSASEGMGDTKCARGKHGSEEGGSDYDDDEDSYTQGSAKRYHHSSMSSSSGRASSKAEDRLTVTRERNRDHSRKSRERKKFYIEGLKKQVEELSAYKMLVEQAGELVSMHNPDEHITFLYASPSFKHELGHEPTTLMGNPLLNLVSEEHRAVLTQQIQETLTYGKAPLTKFKIRHRFGQLMDAEASFRLLPARRIMLVSRLRPPQENNGSST